MFSLPLAKFKMKLKLKHLWEQGDPLVFRGPTQLAYSGYREDRLWSLLCSVNSSTSWGWQFFVIYSFSFLFFSCQVKDVESLCRAPVNECDVPEYCTGLSKHCPENDFKMNGIPCSSGQGYCYNGQCPTHFQHCQRLWGTGTQEFITQQSKTSPRSTDILQVPRVFP